MTGRSIAMVTTEGERCVFPFTYEGEIYTSCTTAGLRPVPWCATQVEEDGVAIRWQNCDINYGKFISIILYVYFMKSIFMFKKDYFHAY